MIGAAFDLACDWSRAWRPPTRQSSADWAEDSLYLPAASNADPGLVVLAPYQRAALDLIDLPSTRIAILQWASQVGKSATLDAYVSYVMAQDPGPTLIVQPTDGKSRDYVVNRLDPLIKATPALRSIVGGGRKGGGDNLNRKQFPGGSLNVASAHKPDDLAARSIRTLLLDEIDRYPLSAGSEGSPDQLALRRTHRYRLQSKILIASTPTVKGSRIAAWFQRGNQMHWQCPCPDCGTFAALKFENLKWTAGDPASAHLSCESCGFLIYENDRRAMIDKGEFIASAEGDPGIVSLHMNVLASRFTTLADIAIDAEDAEQNSEKKRVFVNTSLALVYDDEEAASLNPGDLQQYAVRMDPDALPFDVTRVVSGVDVQAMRLEISFIAMLSAGRAAVLNHIVLPGDTSGHTVWTELDELIGETVFTLRSGKKLKVTTTAIDSGYNTSMVTLFVQRQQRRSRNTYAIKGVSGWDRPNAVYGNRLRGHGKLALLGVDILKANITKRLQMITDQPGRIYLPDHLGIEYFQSLAAEKLVTKYVKGHPRKEWHIARSSGGGNEALDCLVYALGLAGLRKEAPEQPKISIAEAGKRLHDASNRS